MYGRFKPPKVLVIETIPTRDRDGANMRQYNTAPRFQLSAIEFSNLRAPGTYKLAITDSQSESHRLVPSRSDCSSVCPHAAASIKISCAAQQTFQRNEHLREVQRYWKQQNHRHIRHARAKRTGYAGCSARHDCNGRLRFSIHYPANDRKVGVIQSEMFPADCHAHRHLVSILKLLIGNALQDSSFGSCGD